MPQSAQPALAAAAELAAIGAHHAEASEHARRLAPPVVAAFEAGGLARLMAPSALGGGAAHPRVMVEVIEAISAGDASTGWCAGIGIGTNWMACLIPESAARAVYLDLSRGGAGPFAPGAMVCTGGDTISVAGRWPYASNCQQAAVAAVGAVMVDEEGTPRMAEGGGVELGLAFLRADEFAIDETWNTDGLRGTGSHDLTADVTIDAERVSSLWVDKWPDDDLFRLRSFDVLGPGLAAVPLGIGRAALDVLEAKAMADFAGPPARGPRPRLADDPIGQVELGHAQVRLRAARALLLESLDKAMDHAARGDTPPRALTATIGLACHEALGAGKQAVHVAIALAGTAAVREGSALLRLRRDIDTAGSHIMFSPNLASGLARELAGIPTAAFPFLPYEG